MAPPFNNTKDNRIGLSSMNNVPLQVNSSNSIENTPYAIRLREHHERRVSLFHKVVHVLAFLLIAPLLFMIPLQMEVPIEYWTIISVIVGFYFGRSLFNN